MTKNKRIIAGLMLSALIFQGLPGKIQTAYAAAENMIGVQTQNEGMTAVPAPDNVVIDGDLSEWDWSGRIRMFADINFESTYSNETAVMYDDNYYYIGFKVKDPTPMENPYDPVTEGTWIWRKDCVQLRFITDKVMWTTFAWNHEQNRAMLLQDYWVDENNDGGEVDSIIYYSDPYGTKLSNHKIIKLNPRVIDGIELAYKKDVYGEGYNIELKIPWEVLYVEKPTHVSGSTIKMGIEMYWGDNTDRTNHVYNYKDNMQPGETLRDFFWTGKDMWGNVTFSPTGNVPVREYHQEIKPLTTGYFNVDIEVPKTAKSLTAVIKDENGNIIRHLVAEMEIADYITRETDENNVVTVKWDGRNDFEEMVSAGKYTVEGLTHDGIDPYYDITFYNPGKVPWQTPDGTGAWGSDHVTPRSTCAYGDMFYYGWSQAEGGDAIIAVDSDSNKLWGENRGAMLMTANEKYLYSLPTGGFYVDTSNGDTYLMRLDRETGAYRPFVSKDGTERPFELMLSEILGMNGKLLPYHQGLSVYNDDLVIAMAANNTNITSGEHLDYGAGLYVLDANTAELKKKIPLDNVGQIAFSQTTGLLYAISGENICEVDIHSGKIRTIAVNAGADFKMGTPIASDDEGNILVMDIGPDRQIKALSPANGNLVYTVGQKGGRPYVGKWEKEGLTEKVNAISCNNKGEISVTELWEVPRRISVWGKDGKLIRDYIGNAAYGGAGTFIHDQNPELAYVGPVEMKLNRETDSYEVTRILWVPDLAKGQGFPIPTGTYGMVQHFYSDASGERHEYIYQPGYSFYDPTVIYMEDEKGIFKPVSAVGLTCSVVKNAAYAPYDATNTLNYDKNFEFSKLYPKMSTMSEWWLYIWNDENDDGILQESECDFIPNTKGAYYFYLNPRSGWGGRVTHSDMRFLGVGAAGVTEYIPAYFKENGAPVYTFDSIKNYRDGLSGGEEIYVLDGTDDFIKVNTLYAVQDKVFNDISGWTINRATDKLTQNWYIESKYPGVHGSHYALITERNSDITGPIKVLGDAEVNGERVIAIRGNYGCDTMITTDGIQVCTLFVDVRRPAQALPASVEEAKGKNLNYMSEGGEPFSGIMTKQDDGKVRLLTSIARGGGLVCEIRGLETIKRIDPIEITATVEKMEAARVYTEPVETKNTQKQEDTDTGITAKRASAAMTIDGDIKDWQGTKAVEVSGAAESASIRLAYDDEKLYAFFDVKDNSPMVNGGTNFEKMFKTGDVADIFLSPTKNNSTDPASGDLRISLTEMQGKPIAVLYKQKDANADGSNFYNYNSPVGSVDFDVVKIIDNAEISIVKSISGYTLEAAIPFAALGITVDDDTTLSGDVGIVASDEAGTINTARIYYYNKDTGLVSDLPNEARFYPDKWGVIKFSK